MNEFAPTPILICILLSTVEGQTLFLSLATPLSPWASCNPMPRPLYSVVLALLLIPALGSLCISSPTCTSLVHDPNNLLISKSQVGTVQPSSNLTLLKHMLLSTTLFLLQHIHHWWQHLLRLSPLFWFLLLMAFIGPPLKHYWDSPGIIRAYFVSVPGLTFVEAYNGLSTCLVGLSLLDLVPKDGHFYTFLQVPSSSSLVLSTLPSAYWAISDCSLRVQLVAQ